MVRWSISFGSGRRERGSVWGGPHDDYARNRGSDRDAYRNFDGGGGGGFFEKLASFFRQLFGGGGGSEGGSSSARRSYSTRPSGSTYHGSHRGTGHDRGHTHERSYVPSSKTALPGNTEFDSSRALNVARYDNAGGGWCAKGVANILNDQGFNVTRGNAHDWIDTLPRDGWVKMQGITPQNAPEGAILVYDSDVNLNRAPRNKGGGKFGHVEVVCYDDNGRRLYVSDKARTNIGGTVPDNYVGAYMPASYVAKLEAENRARAMAQNDAAPGTNNQQASVDPTTSRTGSVAGQHVPDTTTPTNTRHLTTVFSTQAQYLRPTTPQEEQAPTPAAVPAAPAPA